MFIEKKKKTAKRLDVTAHCRKGGIEKIKARSRREVEAARKMGEVT